MKTFNIVFLIFTLISCSYQKTFAENYFESEWEMYGYGCDGKEPKVEKCRCKTTGKEVICTKTLGDNCVPTGKETFRFEKPALIQTAVNIKLTYLVGSPAKPASGHWRNKFVIDDINNFHSGKRRYVRIAAPVLAAPKPQVATSPAIPVPKPLPRPALPTKPAVGPFVYYYQNYFVGHWNAVGYKCTSKTPKIEKINVTRNGNDIIGTKLTGDECVPAGGRTFHFTQPEKLWRGLFIGKVQFGIGAPEVKTQKIQLAQVHIIDLNSFTIGGHTYYRILAPNFRPDGVYINMSPMLGAVYPGPGYIKLNPKRNMRSPVRRFVIVEEETNKPGNC